MTCPYCGVEAYREESGRHWCGHRDCLGYLCTVSVPSVRHADPAPEQAEWFTIRHQGQPVEVARLRASISAPAGPQTFNVLFRGEGEGQVTFTYEEMLALQRVARAQIEMEKKRGVNQR